MAWWSWSKTAASNSSADSTINWAEGQPPSSVNDSARAMMARAAEYRDDIAGALNTGGTSTAYTLSTNQVFDTLAHMGNALIAFTPHTTNGATVTLNVDGLGAKPLRSAPSIELQSGALIQGTPYVAIYNNSDGVFYLHGASNYNSYSCPLGGGMIYFGSSAPNSAFAFPYGQAVSRTTYVTLFTLLSTTYGTGDGSTTFNLPDLRGRVVAGLDNMGGSSAARLSTVMSSTTLGATGGGQNQTIAQANIPSYNLTVTDPGHTHPVNFPAPDAIVNVDNSPGLIPVYGHSTGSGLVAQLTATSNTTGITVGSAGSGTALPVTQPTMVANYIMRII